LSRGDLMDSEWRILDPLLPNRGERRPAIADKRRTVNGILWVLRTGAPWRDMSERYGNWNSVFVRFTRWSKLGVWDAPFETLASLALLWQIYSGRRSLQIHFRQCGHRCGGSRAKSSRMAWRTAGKVG
jgi:transposase